MSAPTSDLILQRMMALHPKIIDLTLDRMWHLLAALGNPQDALAPVIHIAGTNGKGSTLAMIRAGIEATGLVAHAYTSPHLARFHERIRVAGTLISEPDLMAALDTCYAANDGATITYFEITTCAAFLAFARTRADFTLLEVGMGGRLDATNVIPRPKLTIITPVSMDHQQFLGNTLAKIAFEKAGIIKRGVPCIVAPQADEALEVIGQVAARLGAPLIAHGQHWHVRSERGRLIYTDETGLCDLPLPALKGAHQIDNAGAALAALRHLKLGETAYEGALTEVDWPGRLQRIKLPDNASDLAETTIILDVGHNKDSAQKVGNYLKTLCADDIQTILVMGMLDYRDIGEVLDCFGDLFSYGVAVDLSQFPFGRDSTEIAVKMRSKGMQVIETDNPIAGLKTQRSLAPDLSAVALIFGSFNLAELAIKTSPDIEWGGFDDA